MLGGERASEGMNARERTRRETQFPRQYPDLVSGVADHRHQGTAHEFVTLALDQGTDAGQVSRPALVADDPLAVQPQGIGVGGQDHSGGLVAQYPLPDCWRGRSRSAGITGALAGGLGSARLSRDGRVSPWSSLTRVGRGAGPRLPTVRLHTRERLPALDGHLGVGRIDLDGVAAPTQLFGGYQGRARSGERFVYEIAGAGAVGQALGDEADRLHGRVFVVARGLVVFQDADAVLSPYQRLPHEHLARSSGPGGVAIQDRLVGVVVIGVAQNDAVLDPDQLLVETPADLPDRE